MNQELEIRAVDALKWKKCTKLDGFFDNIGNYIRTEELQFTTSYDWAMLGVKAMNTDDLYTAFIHQLMSKSIFTGIDDIFKATPAQITQAWVEVLEGEKE